MWDSSSEPCKQRYFEDTNNEEESREDNYIDFKCVIKYKIMMMKLVSVTTDGTTAMFGSKVSWLIIIKKHPQEK